MRAHVKKVGNFGFCMIRSPFVITVWGKVTHVHIGRMHVLCVFVS